MPKKSESRDACIRWYKSMLNKIEHADNKILLDLGCGHGYVTSYLIEKGLDVYGLDVNPLCLKELSVKQRFICSDATSLPFKDESIDAILAFEIVEHLENPATALKEMQRTLRNDGILLLTTPTPKSVIAKTPGHINIKDRRAWSSILRSLGFEVHIVTYSYPIKIPILPAPINMILSYILGTILGYWKRYVDVTSAKYFCKISLLLEKKR